MSIQTYINPYKDYLIAAVIIAYSIGIWHISARYTSSTYLKEEVFRAQQVIAIGEKNKELADTLGKKLEGDLANMKINNTTIYRNTQHELVTHKFYTECVNTPDVVQNIESAITNKKLSSSK